MSEKIYGVPAEWAKRAWVDDAKYHEMYARSVSDSDGFWAEQAQRIDWVTPFTKVENASFAPGKISIKWFEDGVLNVAWNCIDRHLETRGDQTAIIWEGDNPQESKHITYRQLHDEVCKMANILRTRNVEKGDRVTIYLPMIPEAAYAMLACARIGAVHSVVFAGFSPDSLAQRITDCQSKIVITADEGLRGGKKVPLKANVDAAIAKSGGVDWVVVVKRTGGDQRTHLAQRMTRHQLGGRPAQGLPSRQAGAEDRRLREVRPLVGPGERILADRLHGELQKFGPDAGDQVAHLRGLAALTGEEKDDLRSGAERGAQHALLRRWPVGAPPDRAHRGPGPTA